MQAGKQAGSIHFFLVTMVTSYACSIYEFGKSQI